MILNNNLKSGLILSERFEGTFWIALLVVDTDYFCLAWCCDEKHLSQPRGGQIESIQTLQATDKCCLLSWLLLLQASAINITQT